MYADPKFYAKRETKNVMEIQLHFQITDPKLNQFVWMDSKIVKVLLFKKKRPKTVTNFLALCGIGDTKSMYIICCYVILFYSNCEYVHY